MNVEPMVIDRGSAVVWKVEEDGWDFPTVNNISGGNQSKGVVTLPGESESHQSFV